ncbi:beta-glucoside-specific PTS transporter subunit IIABC [Cytobacillus gottheilii]|uniref:beta-glucoside-specific PTS transporter subunit IIABC n=1 Tax=Cytobacillus gottheilii TaxID=859144 RepID=UPI0009BBDF03|nr:beta-glucoside-specific PTS transporter subunit IIABC [Cytobacillus gottheilii]
MDYKKTAADILKSVGGENNVVHLGHCATRLRFTLADDSKVNIDELKKVQGVLEVVNKGQFQVIIGNNVLEVYDELIKMGKFGQQENDNNNSPSKKKKIGPVVLDFIVNVFQPLVPAMAGAGILKAILLMLSTLNLVNAEGQTYLILTYISDSVFYFLPILVAFTVAKALKVDHITAAMAAMSMLLFPNMLTLMQEGASFLSFSITNVNYSSQIFPSILGVILYAFMERLFTKISPKPIRVFFVPMMSLLVTVPLTLLVLGPLGFQLGTAMTSGILFIYAKIGWITVGLVAALLPFMIATGMHKVLVPYGISSLSSSGSEGLVIPALLAHNMAESGANLALSFKTKNKSLKSISLSGGISAFFGITEPALYGVTLQRKPILIGVIISSLIGGLSLGVLSVAAYALANPSIASITIFVQPDNPKNILFAIIGLIISFATSFLITLISWKDKELPEHTASSKEQDKENTPIKSVNISEEVILNQPVQGKVIPLSEVDDAVFSTKIMGDGMAVIPSIGELYAPADGVIKMIFDTNHALGMELENGAELLFHIGIDTVQLGGKYFEAQVKVDDEVKAGDLLVKFDIEKIIEEGYDPTTVIVVTNQDRYSVIVPETENAGKEEMLMTVASK